MKLGISALLVAVASGIAIAKSDDDDIVKAKARITSCTDGSFVGTAVLVERPSTEGVKVVDVFVNARGLTPGKHAVHIHEVGNCGGTPPCSAARSHLDLGPFGHSTPVTQNHPYHSGDLVNIEIGHRGTGSLHTTTNRIALSQDSPSRHAGRNLSIFDDDGSSIIIHALPDLYCPDPSDANCAGGARAACGVLQLETER
jgi:superoxide dismutase, Cu-Zn family